MVVRRFWSSSSDRLESFWMQIAGESASKPMMALGAFRAGFGAGSWHFFGLDCFFLSILALRWGNWRGWWGSFGTLRQLSWWVSGAFFGSWLYLGEAELWHETGLKFSPRLGPWFCATCSFGTAVSRRFSSSIWPPGRHFVPSEHHRQIGFILYSIIK